MKKRIFYICLSVILVFGLMIQPAAGAETDSKTAFIGSRTTTWTISQSNLSNYISGGRYALEMLLRSESADWLTYGVHAVNRDVEVTLSFSFTSMQDYLDKSEALLGFTPSVMYSEDGGTTFIENFKSAEYLNWISDLMTSKGLVTEIGIPGLFILKESNLVLNSKTYPAGEQLNIRPGEIPAVVDNFTMDTTESKEGSYERSIVLNFDTEQVTEDAYNYYKNAFVKAAGKKNVEEDKEGDSGSKTLKLKLTAYSLDELAALTQNAFNLPASIKEKENYLDKNSIKVVFNEQLALDSILTEDGTYDYTFTLPGYDKNITLPGAEGSTENAGDDSGTESADVFGSYDDTEAGTDSTDTGNSDNTEAGTDSLDTGNSDNTENGEDSTVTGNRYVDGNTVHCEAARGNVIKFSYDCGLRFDNVKISTDLSRDFNRIKRTISFSLSQNIAAEYHEAVKKALSDLLVRGAKLVITDENGFRYYRITYQAYLKSQLNKFTAKVLDGSGDAVIKQGIIPFTKGVIDEDLEISDIIPGMTPPETVTAEYILPLNSKSELISKDSPVKNIVTVNLKKDSNVSFEYSHMNWIVLGMEAAVIIIIAIVILVIIRKLKNKKLNKDAQDKENKKSEIKNKKVKKGTSTETADAARIKENPVELTAKGKEEPKKAFDGTDEEPKKASDEVEEVPKKAFDKIEEVPKKVSDKVEEVPKKAFDKVEEVPKKASDKAEEILEKADTGITAETKEISAEDKETRMKAAVQVKEASKEAAVTIETPVCRFCTNCGSQLGVNDRFCKKCGCKVNN